MKILLPQVSSLKYEKNIIDLPLEKKFAMARALKSGRIIDWEGEVLACMTTYIQYLSKKVCFMDIGSNISFYSLALKSIFGENLQAYALEPNPFLNQKAKELSNLNNINFNIYNKAISDNLCSKTFFISEKDDCSSLNRIREGISKKIQVDVTTIDQICLEENIIPDIIKIDVEGHENQAISGGMNFIKENKPALIIEIIGKNISKDIEFFLKSLGYHFYLLKKDFTIKEYEYFIPPKTKSEWNWLVLPEEINNNFLSIHSKWVNSIIDIANFKDINIDSICFYNIWEYIEYKMKDYLDLSFYPKRNIHWHAIFIKNIDKNIHFEFNAYGLKTMRIALHFEINNDKANSYLCNEIILLKDKIIEGIPFSFEKNILNNNGYEISFKIPFSSSPIMIELYLNIMKLLINRTYLKLIELFNSLEFKKILL